MKIGRLLISVDVLDNSPAIVEKSLSSEAKKYHYFQVTSCHYFVTTNTNFAYIESE